MTALQVEPRRAVARLEESAHPCSCGPLAPAARSYNAADDCHLVPACPVVGSAGDCEAARSIGLLEPEAHLEATPVRRSWIRPTPLIPVDALCAAVTEPVAKVMVLVRLSL